MKTLITCMLFTLAAMFISADNNDPNFQMTIEGKFFNTSYVKYEVYKANSDGTYTLLESKHSNKFYSVSLELGEKYYVKFTSQNKKVKFLEIDAIDTAFYVLDVDFSVDESASLEFGGNRGYVLSLEKTEKYLRKIH